MKDVAKRAGVARSTVSMALRNDPSISLPTRQRIQRLAEEMGYRTNPMVSALMTGLRTGRKETRPITLAFVSTFPDELEKGMSSLGRYRNGACTHARNLGYHIEHFRLSPPQMTAKRLNEVMRARGITGIVLAPFPDRAAASFQIDWEFFATVAIGHSLKSPQIHRVVHHHSHGLNLAFDTLYSRGYRRIGLIMTSLLDQRVDHNWTAAFLVKRLLHKEDFPMLISETWTEAIFRRWFEREKPDAIVSILPEVPVWLKNLGLRVPEDVGYATLDRCPEAPWPGVDQNSDHIAAAAVDLLVEQLYHNRYGIPETPKSVLIEGKWTGNVRSNARA